MGIKEAAGGACRYYVTDCPCWQPARPCKLGAGFTQNNGRTGTSKGQNPAVLRFAHPRFGYRAVTRTPNGHSLCVTSWDVPWLRVYLQSKAKRKKKGGVEGE